MTTWDSVPTDIRTNDNWSTRLLREESLLNTMISNGGSALIAQRNEQDYKSFQFKEIPCIIATNKDL